MMDKAIKLRDQSKEELEANLQELRKEIFTMRNEKKVSKKNEKPHMIRAMRKQIARVLTVLNEKTVKGA